MKGYIKRVPPAVFVFSLIVVFAVCNFIGQAPVALEKDAKQLLFDKWN